MSDFTYLQNCLKNEKIARWPKDCFPLSVYIAPFTWYKARNEGHIYIQMVHDAFTLWSKASKGLVSFQFVTSLMNSQINLEWKRVDRNALGYCTYNFDKLSRLFSAEIQIGLSDGIIHSKYMNKEEVFHTILHEIGHSLGLGHSPNKSDIMYTPHQYGIVNLSQNDIKTLKWLYSFNNGDTIDMACQNFSTNASTFDELVYHYEQHRNMKQELEGETNVKKSKVKKFEKKDLLQEHTNIGNLKKYVMELQKIEVSKDVSRYLKKNFTTNNNQKKI